ncbi:MAG: OsmC family protein [Eudoraea sp.]|nr:OsmC family protein [Eudoraea sp.]MBT8223210.1 OsmC family protein [Eudoraea sp.]NNK30028.1 OsmC family protein [Flavobacteriaceae bacterium]
MTSKVTYLGELRTQCRHLRSGNEFITDAPLDNNGRGEAFSPTDTVATALASCMLTVMGIKAKSMDIELKGAYAEVTKKMAANPRRISGIEVTLYLSSAIGEKEQGLLERVGNTCPVMQSIHPDIETVIHYHWEL